MTKHKVGDRIPIPTSAELHSDEKHFGKVVWISENGKTIAIRCEKSHNGKMVVLMMKTNSNE